jgi:hypothetical protein
VSVPDSAEAYVLFVLTDQWEWEETVSAATVGDAKDAARAALERVVKEEAPELACITLARAGVKLGVWDWVEGQAYWSEM